MTPIRGLMIAIAMAIIGLLRGVEAMLNLDYTPELWTIFVFGNLTYFWILLIVVFLGTIIYIRMKEVKGK
ncbi:hypothetical protein HYW55_06665 [Candidatus Gottesmanbacteria bacterium]|nr:hypothetical protein [Candidatus Gottesmanbacteria bacterium]